MTRKPTSRSFDGSFLDYQRILNRMTMPDMYHALGWSRERYYSHCKNDRLFPRSELAVLSQILNKPIKRLYQEEHEFYFGSGCITRESV